MTLWIDAGAGASGDMLLGALVDLGVRVEVLADAVAAVAPEPVTLRVERTQRNGLAATRVHVETAPTQQARTWREVRALLEQADLDDTVQQQALSTFARLAAAEARVHGTTPEEVHFHEVGALDAIADVVGVCTGLALLGEDEVVVSPVAVGSGRVGAAHGSLPVPVPAVVELLRGAPSWAGPGPVPGGEMCTPTGAALLVTWAGAWGAQPAMAVGGVGVGAGSRDPSSHPNVLRFLTGDAVGDTAPAGALLLETNVDDLDPRLWPGVLAALLTAGAGDAWLTPILMKKGRPAHTLSVLVRPDALAAVREVVYTQTSTIGMRVLEVGKHALDREMVRVTVHGHPVAVKLARLEGRVVNAMPEFADVAALAARLDRPVDEVLLDARAEARRYRD